ncbi:MAG: restriction endonuclease subunit S [Meiothermus ruber]|nr:restriction endonuclease subunit S [Meiothermus ruber]
MPDKKKGVVPRLRFPEFRDAGPWEVKRLGEICSFLKGKGLPKTAITAEGSVPCIHYGELFTEYGEVIHKVKSYTNTTTDSVLSEEDDVLMPTSDVTPNGLAKASCIKEKNVVLGGDILVIRPNKQQVFGEYLSRYIRYQEKDVLRLVTGTTVFHLYGNAISHLRVSLPRMSEQQKIADCLSSLDELIELQAKKLEALQAHKKGLMQQLFPREGETTPRLRFPEFRNAGPWEVSTLENIFTVRDERRPQSSEWPLFSLTIEDGVTEKSERYDREFLVTNKGEKKYKAVYPNDIVYNPANLRWGAIAVHKRLYPVVVSPIYEVLYLSHPDSMVQSFVEYALTHPTQIRRFATKGQGTLLERIAVKIDDFLSTRIAHPKSCDEQQKIADCLSSLDELIELQAKKLEALKAHKKGLMQQLFPQEVG